MLRFIVVLGSAVLAVGAATLLIEAAMLPNSVTPADTTVVVPVATDAPTTTATTAH